MKVEIKERQLTAGNRSLYLEYYETGFRKKENLHLYLIPDDAPHAKKLNGETYRKAQEIRAQRILNPPTFEKKKKTDQGDFADSGHYRGGGRDFAGAFQDPEGRDSGKQSLYGGSHTGRSDL